MFDHIFYKLYKAEEVKNCLVPTHEYNLTQTNSSTDNASLVMFILIKTSSKLV